MSLTERTHNKWPREEKCKLDKTKRFSGLEAVSFYETVAQTSHKNINQGIFENILKNREKSIKHIDVYGANAGPKWTFSLIF
jgi:hypothetical protein